MERGRVGRQLGLYPARNLRLARRASRLVEGDCRLVVADEKRHAPFEVELDVVGGMGAIAHRHVLIERELVVIRPSARPSVPSTLAPNDLTCHQKYITNARIGLPHKPVQNLSRDPEGRTLTSSTWNRSARECVRFECSLGGYFVRGCLPNHGGGPDG